MFSSIIWSIVIGLVVGLLGRVILPGRQNISLLVTTLIGMAAAFVAGLILGATTYSNANGGVPWLTIVLGAILAAVGIVVYGRTVASRV